MDVVTQMELVLSSFPKKHSGPTHQRITGARAHYILPAESPCLLKNTLEIPRIGKKDTASIVTCEGVAALRKGLCKQKTEVLEERWEKGGR